MYVDGRGHEDMLASEYIRERERLCNANQGNCACCPFGEGIYDRDYTACYERTEEEDPLKAVAIVLKWSKENPVVTNGLKLRETFSNIEFEPVMRNGVEGAFIPYSWFRKPYSGESKTD